MNEKNPLKKIRPLHWQMMFVTLAFMLLAGISAIHAYDMLKIYLETKCVSLLEQFQDKLRKLEDEPVTEAEALARVREIVEGNSYCYGILVDSERRLIAHPNEDSYMMNVADFNPEFAAVIENLAGQTPGTVKYYELNNYKGELVLAYGVQLDNGWFLFAHAISGEYYEDYYDFLMVLVLVSTAVIVISCLILVYIDNERKAADESLREATTRLEINERAGKLTESLLKHAPFGTMIFDSDMKPIMCNDEMAKFLGAKDAQDAVERFFEFSPERQPDGVNSRERANFYLERVLAEGYRRFEWTHLTAAGKEIPTEVALIRVELGGRRVVAGYSRDLRAERLMIARMQKETEEQIMTGRLMSILNGLDAMIYVTDPLTDEILFINNRMKEHFGIKGNVNGQKCYSVLQKNRDSRCEFCPCRRLSLDSDAPIVWDEHNTLTGRTYRNTDRLIPWPGEKRVHIQHSIDVTENRVMITRLNSAMAAAKLAWWTMDLVPDDMFNPDNEVTYSDEFRHMLGYSDKSDYPDSLASFVDGLHPDDKEFALKKITGNILSPNATAPFSVEYRLMNKDGEYRWYRASGEVVRDSLGNPLRIIGALMDIDEQMKSIEMIKENREYIAVLFDNSPVGVAVYDEKGLVDCNKSFDKMLNMSREDYPTFFEEGKYHAVTQPDGRNSIEKVWEIIGRSLQGETVKTEWVHIDANGEPFPVELTLTKITRAGKDYGVAYVYDMREPNRLQKELEEALHKAREASRVKSAFLANISHEIRTPMNAIMGITEIFLSDDSFSPETMDAVERIYDSGNLLLNIINDILDMSKIESGKMEISPVNYNIPSLVNDAVQLNRLRYDFKPIEFVLYLDKDTPFSLFGDELRIKQIIGNIISNAFKYTDAGEIKMSVWAEEPDENQPSESESGAGNKVNIVFRVSDTGKGISDEHLRVLFDGYSQFNLSASRNTIGTGMGLNIANNLVTLMGGSIKVESEKGKGSVFTVTIPQERVDERVCGPKIAERLREFNFRSAHLTLAKKTQLLREYMPYGKVLIVDDVESNLYVARGLLLPYGLQVETVNSGFEAIEKIKAGNVYDIIFMDHMMPGMDGIETTAKIRALKYSGVIVALTANALVGHDEMFIKNGFDSFIAKPIDSRELNAALNMFIRNRNSPETVKAARRQMRAERLGSEDGGIAVFREKGGGKIKVSDFQLEEFFMLDAENAVKILSGLNAKIDSGEFGDPEYELFEITVHGIKSALNNIGRVKFAAQALALEEAAQKKDIDTIRDNTPALVETLKGVIGEIEWKRKES